MELGTLYTPKGNVMVERLRDILKGCVVKTAKGITYLLIGIEHQSDIHYAMPIKVLIQDAGINLIVPDEIEDFDRFKTELGIVMDFLRCSDNKESMKKL